MTWPLALWTALWLTGCDPTPGSDLLAYDPVEAGRKVGSLPAERAFHEIFSYGEATMAERGMAEAVERGARLPTSAQHDFFDGAAHGWRVPLGSDPAVLYAELSAAAPRLYRERFEDAVARSWTEQLDGVPGLVVPRVEAWARITGTPVALDGVRVGLQRSRGDDLAAALAVAARYPTDWQPALYEELGWRAAQSRWVWGWRWERTLGTVPPATQCAFVHGSVRGRLLLRPWTDTAQAAAFAGDMAGHAGGCPAAASQGLAWGALIAWGPDADRRLVELPEGPQRDSARLALRRITSRDAPPPWALPSEPL